MRSMTKNRWIRIFHFNNYPPYVGPQAKKNGDFLGVINVGTITEIYPDSVNPDFVKIRRRGDPVEKSFAWTGVLKTDLHEVEPSLAVVFPLGSEAQHER